jgi:tRNA nucleotidyltransferase (CCA-adding enzyme)
MTDLAAVLASVREQVVPDADERERLAAAVRTLLERTREAAADTPATDVVHVGSTARGTWLAGDHDVDIFVRFPTDCDRETLAEYGRQVGHAVLPEGREEYAEHPYVTGSYDGIDVDIVPCYAVADATDIRSAVDRTPFHTAYLEARLDDDLADEVRLCKAFLRGIGVYGSDLRTRGVSGYLAELLVVEYGDFEAAVAAIADWHPPVRLDPEGHGEATFDAPLVVVDPTDPGRNVAAVLATENVARLQHYARALLAAPDAEYFTPDDPEPLTAAALETHLDRRETTPVAVRFDAPDLVEDDLYPQLRRSLGGVRDALERHGFTPLRTATFAADSAVLLLELEAERLPAVERHGGPPVHVAEHARSFYEQYADDPSVYGPFIEADRYVVERPREYTSAAELLDSDAIFDVALGVAVESALQDSYEVLVGREIETLLPEFAVELRGYVEPRP